MYIPKPYLNWYGPTATTRITANCDSDVTLAASSGESYGNSEYYELPKNLPTSSANTPELEGPIQELQKMYEVAEHDINVIGWTTDIFTQPNEINPMEINNDGTTPAENYQDSFFSQPHVTKSSSLHSPLADASVNMYNPPPHPCVEGINSACLLITSNLL